MGCLPSKSEGNVPSKAPEKGTPNGPTSYDIKLAPNQSAQKSGEYPAPAPAAPCNSDDPPPAIPGAPSPGAPYNVQKTVPVIPNFCIHEPVTDQETEEHPDQDVNLVSKALGKTSHSRHDPKAGSMEEDSDWDECSSSHNDFNQVQGEQQNPHTSNCRLREPTILNRIEGDARPSVLHTEPRTDFRKTETLHVEKVGGCMFVNQYLVLKFLGKGACGKVFLCLNTLDLKLYAMKAVRKVDLEGSACQQHPQQQQPPQGGGNQQGKQKRNPMEDLKREIMIMKRMKHPNIVTLREIIDDPGGSKLLLVMEFVEGGPILTREALEKKDKLPETIARKYFRDMVKALDYLHSRKVVHGDLKPENALMTSSGEVKLSDFGCSKVMATGNEYLERCNGTPAFLAPEMMRPNVPYRGRPTDVYALGACIYTLVFGRIPFSAPNLYKLFQVVQHDPVHYPESTPISDSLRDCLEKTLRKDPKKRITLHELMRHPWGTMDGQFPLKPTRELKPGETQEAHDGIDNSEAYAKCHPRPDYLAGMATFSSMVHTFDQGDYIMRQGDAGTFLVYVMEGTVDVLINLVAPGAPSKPGISPAPGQNPGNSATGGGWSMWQQPGAAAEERENGDGMAPAPDEASLKHREELMKAAEKAQQFVRSLQRAGRSARGDLLVAQKGAGELLGEMSLFSKSITRCASVRCATKVTACVITHEQLVQYLLHQPMAKHQIRENIRKKEGEITMVDALVKLSAVHAPINASLALARNPSMVGLRSYSSRADGQVPEETGGSLSMSGRRARSMQHGPVDHLSPRTRPLASGPNNMSPSSAMKSANPALLQHRFDNNGPDHLVHVGSARASLAVAPMSPAGRALGRSLHPSSDHSLSAEHVNMSERGTSGSAASKLGGSLMYPEPPPTRQQQQHMVQSTRRGAAPAHIP